MSLLCIRNRSSVAPVRRIFLSRGLLREYRRTTRSRPPAPAAPLDWSGPRERSSLIRAVAEDGFPYYSTLGLPKETLRGAIGLEQVSQHLFMLRT